MPLTEQNVKTLRNVVAELVRAEISVAVWPNYGEDDIELRKKRLKSARNNYNSTLRKLLRDGV